MFRAVSLLFRDLPAHWPCDSWSRNHLSSDENYSTPRDSLHTLYLPHSSFKNVSQQMPDLLNPQNRNTYADRPVTPVGNSTGLTETRTNDKNKPTQPKEDRYRYQPAYFWSHPADYLRKTSNYLKACAARAPRTAPKTDQATRNGVSQNGSKENNGVVKGKVVEDKTVQALKD